MLFRTKDDITSADHLPAAHMKNKKYGSNEILYTEHIFITIVHYYITTIHLHIRLLYSYGFALLLHIFSAVSLLLYFTTFYFTLHFAHFFHTAQPLLISYCSLLDILLFT